MSADEFAATVLMPTAAAQPAASPSSPSSRKLLIAGNGAPKPAAYPATLSWAAKVLPGVGMQRQCGSSWAFAAAEAMESKLMIGANLSTTAALSPQHIMVSRWALRGWREGACLLGMGRGHAQPSCVPAWQPRALAALLQRAPLT